MFTLKTLARQPATATIATTATPVANVAVSHVAGQRSRAKSLRPRGVSCAVRTVEASPLEASPHVLGLHRTDGANNST